MKEVKQIIDGIQASDGDGVQLVRIIGTSFFDSLDPFLLFDAFGSDKPQDYIGGFPSHPHRGFETVTYMLAGKMRHEDSAGNSGVIESGGVQWMTAGKGIIHSEMPEQEEGLLAGFQLWVNLPASHKMIAPAYQEKSAEEVPSESRGEECTVKVIAGTTRLGTKGIIENNFVNPTYWDIHLSQSASFEDAIPVGHNSFIYLIEGSVIIGQRKTLINKGQMAVLGSGASLKIESQQDARFLIIAGKPLNEPVERAGPFVMNTRREVAQAFADYQAGKLA
ncbi:MAG: pirin family protein [Gammaproteobacteria bacterium]|nr:pirin family protein [Gammaproteobacteria bacterium]